jgi:signal transduction histidine kinase
VTHDRTPGIECVSSMPWGTHLCEFYSSREELAETLAPYFAAGLQQDEFCLCVTSDPSGVDGAKTALREVAPYLSRHLDTGQIEIWDCHDWYLRGGHFDADRVFGQWVEREERALDSGYKGLRLTGDMAWLEKGDWPDFMAYEAEVNRTLRQHRMIGLCTYPLDRCTPNGVLEVVRNHQFVLGRIAGDWEMLASSRLKVANEDLRRLNDLKDQVEQTGELETAKTMLSECLRIETSVSDQLQQLSAHLLGQQDEERRWIATQLHEVTAQNLSAIAIYLASLQQRTSAWPSDKNSILAKCRTLCKQSMEQILALTRLLHPPIQDQFGLAASLEQYIEDFMKQSHIHVEFKTAPEIGRLPLDIETHLFRVAQEGLSNIFRHSGSHNAIVRLEKQADQVILQIEDFGRGMPATATVTGSGGARKIGLGILGMQVRLRKIGGHLEIRSSNQGTMLTASVRLSEELQ